MAGFPTASRLAASWVDRLRLLQTNLHDQPNSWRAWHWEIQAKVLRYLILRYGDDPLLDLQYERPHYRMFDHLPAATLLSVQRPRSRAELRSILDRIAEINTYKLI
jgi:hypothetical protein